MSAPMYVVVIGLEEPVLVYANAGTDGQLARLDRWVRDHPELDDLLTHACQLAGAERAA